MAKTNIKQGVIAYDSFAPQKGYEKSKQREGLDFRGGRAISEAHHLECPGGRDRHTVRANPVSGEVARRDPTDLAWQVAV
jgi:hypothetical protein